jgi:polyferredoxin
VLLNVRPVVIQNLVTALFVLWFQILTENHRLLIVFVKMDIMILDPQFVLLVKTFVVLVIKLISV